MRARFTVDEIASAALGIVDASGPEALSMRALAAALGTGPMTMYNYVADKEALEELVVAAVVAEITVPAATDDWRHDVHAIATAMWCGVRAHPAAIPLVLTRRMSSATGFAVADALVAALGRAGLSDADRLSAFHAVLGLVTGSAQAQLAGHADRWYTRGREPHRIGGRGRVSAYRNAVARGRADTGHRRLRRRTTHADRRHRDACEHRYPCPRCSS